jgi:ribosomal protein L39E
MTIANTRIPYWSTLQLDSDLKAEGPALYGLGGVGGPANPSPQPFVRGEKQWMDNAQNIGDWGDHQMTVANTRIPYWSTLQLDSQINTNADGIALYGLGGVGGPANPSPQPFVRGEKQWMDNGQNINDWGTHQMEVANARIPYWSTLVQTNSKDFDQDYEKEVDMNILYEKDIQTTNPEKVSYENIPLSQHLVQIRQDDDPSKMEGMLMEDTNIPLNLRLVHIETQEGDELIKIE